MCQYNSVSMQLMAIGLRDLARGNSMQTCWRTCMSLRKFIKCVSYWGCCSLSTVMEIEWNLAGAPKFAKYFLLLRISSYKKKWKIVRFWRNWRWNFFALAETLKCMHNILKHIIDKNVASEQYDWLIKLNNDITVLVSSWGVQLFVHLIPSI